jgi:uncharacterized damage-inducible protein DinB
LTAKDAIRRTLDMAGFLTQDALRDLSDADLLVRTSPAANHIAWQLGHLLISGRRFLSALGRPAPDLPDGFEAAHARENAASDDPGQFAMKAEYLSRLDALRAAARAAVDEIPDEQLDDPGPESSRSYAPTVGDVLLLLGTHELMHVGQFVAVRRKLNKPVLY